LAERVRRAFLTLAKQPDKEIVWMYHSEACSWPDVVWDYWEGYQNDPVGFVESFEPSSEDIDTYLDTLDSVALYGRLNGRRGTRNLHIIQLNAYGYSWSTILDRLRGRYGISPGASSDAIRKHYERAIDEMERLGYDKTKIL